MIRRPRLLLVLLGVVLTLVMAPAISAQTTESEQQGFQSIPPVAVVHQVDATGAEVEISVLTHDYSRSAGDLSITENGNGVAASSARKATSAGRSIEIVYVIDTSQRTAQGDVFVKAKEQIASDIRSLPNGTRVGVVVAGDSAAIAMEPTLDLAAAAGAVEGLELSENAVLFNAITRAGEMVTADPGWISTVVVFTAGPDAGSPIEAGQSRVSLVQRGAQMVAVEYAGGELGLTEIVSRIGGTNIVAGGPADIAPALKVATQVASDRLLVTYPGATESTKLGDATINLGDVETSYSYPGGVLTDRTVALVAREIVDPGGIAFFRSEQGLLIAIGLAFAGIGLAIYSLGLLFASGETSLQRLLDRYSGENDGTELDDDEQALVQTALVKRAVEFSETFAEDRGFLGKIEELLERAKLPLRPGEAISFFAAAVVLCAGLGFAVIGGIIGLLLSAFLSGVIMIVGAQMKAKRRIRAFEGQLPDTLTLLAGTLRAGYSLPQGFEAVSHEISDPMGYELRRVMTEARLGRELEDALGSTAERLSSPDFAWAVMAIGIQREVGGNLNELLMTVADTMIARERLKGEVAALTAEGRMSAMILGGLPPGLGVIMWVMNPEYINVLFTATLGKIFVGLGLVSMTAGMAWMKKVITIDV
jgi:tight adherence protein B